jgi:hypothetical protein
MFIKLMCDFLKIRQTVFFYNVQLLVFCYPQHSILYISEQPVSNAVYQIVSKNHFHINDHPNPALM